MFIFPESNCVHRQQMYTQKVNDFDFVCHFLLFLCFNTFITYFNSSGWVQRLWFETCIKNVSKIIKISSKGTRTSLTSQYNISFFNVPCTQKPTHFHICTCWCSTKWNENIMFIPLLQNVRFILLELHHHHDKNSWCCTKLLILFPFIFLFSLSFSVFFFFLFSGKLIPASSWISLWKQKPCFLKYNRWILSKCVKKVSNWNKKKKKNKLCFLSA